MPDLRHREGGAEQDRRDQDEGPRQRLVSLTPRELDVLALIAEGHSNAAIARGLVVTEAAVGKHVGNILAKLDLPPSQEVNRRVLAVLAYLRGGAR
ncbi:helix-turn-helix transcriptional regulator [Thermobifida halotolerans]|uniref:Helix-turn-helix transcriptional regulator n=1 Tax=Thermobifida halotolerans TaxID=483545 RepID=A0AA97LYJ1_9ACTN|nr:helix-turn-helix transcriptional regulator [Thermobifida halotolerans]